MLNKTLYFGNPAYLSTKLNQLVIKITESNQQKIIPIEDISLIILDNQQITISSFTLNKCLENNVAVIICNEKHHPTGMLLNLDGHTKQSRYFQNQIKASKKLINQLWTSTIQKKIENQHKILNKIYPEDDFLLNLSKNVKYSDKNNSEARAAAYYWKKLSPKLTKGSFDFNRGRFEENPNNLFNYGYAILRAIVARNLVGSGLLPTFGIFHRNQYNAYCLADDIMEPYRPIVDALVIEIIENPDFQELELTKQVKAKLLILPQIDVKYKDLNRPLAVAIQYTTASLARSFENNQNELIYADIK